jgi:osmotically-inducible protein OsmY
MRKFSIYFSLLLIINLSACVETVAVGTVVTGGLVLREKSIVNTKDDLVITSKIIKEFTLNGLKKHNNSIDVIVNEKRVLLTGNTENEEIAKKASDIAWKVKNVKEVIDEIQIVKNKGLFGSLFGYCRDAMITSEVNSRLLLEKNISSSNYHAITVNKIVYLIGIAQDESEIAKATKAAAKARGVIKVISHVILKEDQRRS